MENRSSAIFEVKTKIMSMSGKKVD